MIEKFYFHAKTLETLNSCNTYDIPSPMTAAHVAHPVITVTNLPSYWEKLQKDNHKDLTEQFQVGSELYNKKLFIDI